MSDVWTIHYCEGLFCILLYSKGSVACWLLGGGSCWFPFHVIFRTHGEAGGSHWSICFLVIRKDGSSARLGAGGRGKRELSLEPLRFSWTVQPLGQKGWPTVLPSLPALHLVLIKYTADDVSLAPGSLSFPLGTKHPGRQLWQLKSEDPSFVCSEVIKINLPKHLQMQIKPSAD